MFSIILKNSYWVNHRLDDPYDLCLHGDVIVTIGEQQIVENNCTVSATALFLLKSLTENHIINESNQMLPCCGHSYWPNKSNDTVEITGCSNGYDWTIMSTKSHVEIVTAEGTKTTLTLNDYAAIVYAFANQVQDAYEKALPKHIPKNDIEKIGYVAFWNEWSRRCRKQEFSFFCPAISQTICKEQCQAFCQTKRTLKEVGKINLYKNMKAFHSICQICSHKQ